MLDVFRLKYDYHNIKTLLKAPQDAERLLIDAGTVPAETMRKKHAENGGWDFLPADMAAAADEAQRVLAETGSAAAATASWIGPTSRGWKSWRRTATYPICRTMSAP